MNRSIVSVYMTPVRFFNAVKWSHGLVVRTFNAFMKGTSNDTFGLVKIDSGFRFVKIDVSSLGFERKKKVEGDINLAKSQSVTPSNKEC